MPPDITPHQDEIFSAARVTEPIEPLIDLAVRWLKGTPQPDEFDRYGRQALYLVEHLALRLVDHQELLRAKREISHAALDVARSREAEKAKLREQKLELRSEIHKNRVENRRLRARIAELESVGREPVDG